MSNYRCPLSQSPFSDEDKKLFKAVCRVAQKDIEDCEVNKLLAICDKANTTGMPIPSKYGKTPERILALYKAVKTLAEQSDIKEKNLNRRKIDNINSLIRFCDKRIGYSKEEKMMILLLDERFYLKGIRMAESGGAFACSIPTEELKETLEVLSPCNIIMVHSHPYGDVSASKSDFRATNLTRTVAKRYGSRLCEHFIFSRVSGELIFNCIMRSIENYESGHSFSKIFRPDEDIYDQFIIE